MRVIGRAPATPSGRVPEVVLGELLEAQAARFAAVDPELPAPAAPPPGEVLVVGDGAGGEAAGVVGRHHWPAGSAPLLWSAAEVTELHPVLGPAGAPGVSALLAAWRARVPAEVLAAADSAAAVTWPSRDVVATRAFLDHGLIPLAVLAVRRARAATGHAAAPGPPGLEVRRAGPADLETCVRLAMDEVAYSSLVGGSVLRADAEAIKRTTLADRLGRGEPVWLAQDADGPAGLLECGVAESVAGSWLASLLPAGRWGYVNCASVAPARRGAGVGRALVDVALPELERGTRGTYLYYNPPNPLSSVFWPSLGYRPLWTLWETRPAAGLR